jgi:hypothetical protein
MCETCRYCPSPNLRSLTLDLEHYPPRFSSSIQKLGQRHNRPCTIVMLGDHPDVTKNARVALDRLFQVDAVLSMSIGLLGVALPHAILVVAVVEYNHNVHEMVRCVISCLISFSLSLLLYISHISFPLWMVIAAVCLSAVCLSVLYLSLYASLRLAMGWMLWNVRRVDDGLLRRRICESLLACNTLQSIVVLRAILTTTTSDSDPTTTQQRSSSNNNLYNWFIFILLTVLAFSYGRFRFGRNGNLIKIYELPTSGTLR